MTFPCFNDLHGEIQKANKKESVSRKGGFHKKGKKKNFQKELFSKLTRYYYTEFINAF